MNLFFRALHLGLVTALGLSAATAYSQTVPGGLSSRGTFFTAPLGRLDIGMNRVTSRPTAAKPIAAPAIPCIESNQKVAAGMGSPVSGENIDSILSGLDATKKVIGAGDDIAIDDVYPLVGKCVYRPGQPDTEANVTKQIAYDFKNHQQEFPEIYKSNGDKAESEDWVAVDLLARTIMNEVGSQPANKCGDQYPKAVGKVIMNRKDFVEQDKTGAFTQFVSRDAKESKQHPLTKVILEDRQFSVWDDGDSIVKRNASCPPKFDSQYYPFRDSKGKEISTGKASADLWKRSLKVAMRMVFREEEFKKETAGITAVFYTSTERMSKNRAKGGYELLNQRIGGKSVNKPDCIQLWAHREFDWKPKPSEAGF